MDIYEQIHMERMARYERRMARLERERRIGRILGPTKTVLQWVLAGAIAYIYLFAIALWASM